MIVEEISSLSHTKKCEIHNGKLSRVLLQVPLLEILVNVATQRVPELVGGI